MLFCNRKTTQNKQEKEHISVFFNSHADTFPQKISYLSLRSIIPINSPTLTYSSRSPLLFKALLVAVTLIWIILIIVIPFVMEAPLVYLVYAFGVMLIWQSIIVSRVFFSLKNVSVDESGITLHSRRSTQTVAFKHVQTVRLFDLTNPWGVTVRYIDQDSGEVAKFSYLTNNKHADTPRLDKMTVYLRDQARAHNSNFQESSALKNFAVGVLAASPFLILAFYLVDKSEVLSLFSEVQ